MIKELLHEYYGFINHVPWNKQYLYGFNIAQNMEEIEQVCTYLKGRKFKYFVEIGAASGGSLWLYSQLLCDEEAKVCAIEPQDNKSLQYVVNHINKTKKQKAVWHKNVSYAIAEEFFDNQIDLLHIDASHAYEDVNIDFNTFYPKVREGGVILLHDTALHNGVIRFKDELEQKNYKILTFKDKSYPIGISVLSKDGFINECPTCQGKGYV